MPFLQQPDVLELLSSGYLDQLALMCASYLYTSSDILMKISDLQSFVSWKVYTQASVCVGQNSI
jgi:hypothetical protein